MNRTSTETLLDFGAHITTPLEDLHLPLKFSLRFKRVGFLDSLRFISHDFPTKYCLHSKKIWGSNTLLTGSTQYVGRAQTLDVQPAYRDKFGLPPYLHTQVD